MLRDDIIEYSLDTHHSEEQGKVIRKKIYKVTIILTVITIVEVLIGAYMGRSNSSGMTWELIKYGYIALTLVKAAYIVLSFMHLGDEKKALKYFVLIPYFIFMAYFIFIMLTEGLAVGETWSTYTVN
jgi:cytochrome c oxidase subunit 4